MSRTSALARCVTASRHGAAVLSEQTPTSTVPPPPFVVGGSPQIFCSDAVEFYLPPPPEINFSAFRGSPPSLLGCRNSFGASHLGGPLHRRSPGEVIQVEEVQRDAEPLSDY